MGNEQNKTLADIFEGFPYIKLAKNDLIIEKSKEALPEFDEIDSCYAWGAELKFSKWAQHHYCNFYNKKYELNFAKFLFKNRISVAYSDREVYDKIYKMLCLKTNGYDIGIWNYLCRITKNVERIAFVNDYVSSYFPYLDYNCQRRIAKEYLEKYKEFLPMELRSCTSLGAHIKDMIVYDLLNKIAKRSDVISKKILDDEENYKMLQKEIAEKKIHVIIPQKKALNYKFPSAMPENKREMFVKWEEGYQKTMLKPYRCPNKYCGGVDFEFKEFEHRQQKDDDDIFSLPRINFTDREWMARLNCNCCNGEFMVTIDKYLAYTISFGELNQEWVEREKPRLLACKRLLKNAVIPFRKIKIQM